MAVLPRIVFLALASASVAVAASAQSSADESSLGVIPRPRALTRKAGAFTLGARTVIVTDAASAATGRQLARYLEPGTGLVLPVRTGAPNGTNVIDLRRDPSLAKTLGSEGYKLSVRAGRVTARAAGDAGLFYAVQTMRQLLPAAVFRDAPAKGVTWTMPAVDVEDAPRFGWRGAHLDVGRHYMPKEFIKKYLDLLALHKLNTFHWHLTEDQGWRLEIKKYPRLTEIGSWRAATPIGHMVRDTTKLTYSLVPHGGFYTQDDAREIVAYAAARHITVVPEIEMPGHARAAIAAYPELGITGQPMPVWTGWGVTPWIFNANDRTIAFMQDVLTEVLDIFPSTFIHVGGDEAAKDIWKTDPGIQARIKELGLKDEHELQSWFIKKMDDFLTAKGRRLIGWDEILEGGLAPGATVMSWRGMAGGIAAAKAGHDVVMAPTTYAYLDYYQTPNGPNRALEPVSIGGYLPIDTVYAFEPIAPALDSAQAKHVLGGQAQLWTEYVPTPKQAEYMLFPRMTAVAEVLWTPKDRKDFADFKQRLTTHLGRLDALDVNYYKAR